MPGRNGTGPMGFGAMTGRGLGACTGVDAPLYGGGFGRGFSGGFCRGSGRGFGRGFGAGFGRGFGYWRYPNYSQTTSREMLLMEKEQLENKLDTINKQLEG